MHALNDAPFVPPLVSPSQVTQHPLFLFIQAPSIPMPPPPQHYPLRPCTTATSLLCLIPRVWHISASAISSFFSFVHFLDLSLRFYNLQPVQHAFVLCLSSFISYSVSCSCFCSGFVVVINATASSLPLSSLFRPSSISSVFHNLLTFPHVAHNFPSVLTHLTHH